MATRARTSWIVRTWRITRASIHLCEGLATLAFAFPWLPRHRRQTLIRAWSGRLLRIFAVRTVMRGRLHEHGGRGLVLVANHVSWLDIFVLNAIQPARFVAKAELRRWPLIGWLIAGVGTLFIDRGSRRQIHEVNATVRAALAQGDVVAVFPEGGIGDGLEMRPFHGSLLQPVVEGRGHVQPVAIRYCDQQGEPTVAAAYVDELSFVASVWRIAGEPMLRVELTLAPALAGDNGHRRELARTAERIIRAALATPDGGSAPDTRDDRRA